MSENQVKVFAGGLIYEAWKSVSIERNLNSLCGSFNLAVSDRWRADRQAWPLRPGVLVEVAIDSEKILKGYIDKVRPSFSGSNREIVIEGRDVTSDLVDCSIATKPFEFKNVGLLDLAKKFCEPFKIVVKSVGPLGDKFDRWTVKQGETVFESLERAARLRGILLITNAAGELVLTPPGGSRSGTDLIQGENILEGSATYDHANRFSEVIVKGNMNGTDEFNGVHAASAKGSAQDEGIGRYRPLVLVADSSVNNTSAKRRAEWEVSIRAAKSVSISVGVVGWKRADKKLWQVGELARVSAGFLGIDQDMLITTTNFVKGGGGTLTNLELVRPDAYLPFTSIKKSKDPITQLGWVFK